MVGNAIRIGVMAAVALVGGMHVASAVPQSITNDPRVIMLEAQWKVVNGDAEGASRLLRHVNVKHDTAPAQTPLQACQRVLCPSAQAPVPRV
jgi:hypothetical protein